MSPRIYVDEKTDVTFFGVQECDQIDTIFYANTSTICDLCIITLMIMDSYSTIWTLLELLWKQNPIAITIYPMVTDCVRYVIYYKS